MPRRAPVEGKDVDLTTLAILRKFWPLFVIVPLAFLVLFQRNTITGRTAERDAAVARVADVTEANKGLAHALDTVKQARVDNDAIADAVAARIGSNQTRLVETRTIIERAKANEPAVRAWGDAPVPSSVRAALRAREAAPNPR